MHGGLFADPAGVADPATGRLAFRRLAARRFADGRCLPFRHQTARRFNGRCLTFRRQTACRFAEIRLILRRSERSFAAAYRQGWPPTFFHYSGWPEAGLLHIFSGPETGSVTVSAVDAGPKQSTTARPGANGTTGRYSRKKDAFFAVTELQGTIARFFARKRLISAK